MYSQAVRSQGRVLLALMLHEASTRYSGKRLGYLWAILEPMAHIVLLVLVRHAIGGRVPLGNSIFVFIATGLLPFFLFRNSVRRVTSSLRTNDALLTYPVVKPPDVALGRGLLEAATMLLIMFIMFSALQLLGHGAIPANPLVCMAALLALFSIGLGAGLVLALGAAFFPSVTQLASVLLRLLYWLSGVFYLPSSLPPAILDYLRWNPILHGIEWFRVGFYPRYGSYILSVEYVCLWGLGLLILAFALERLMRRKVSTL